MGVRDYILSILQECGISVSQLLDEIKRLDSISRNNDLYFQIKSEISKYKSILDIFEKGYFEVDDIIYRSKPYIEFGDSVRFCLDKNQSISKVKVISTNDSTLMLEVTDSYVYVQESSDIGIIDKLLSLSKKGQSLYQDILAASKQDISSRLQELQKSLDQHPYQNAEPINDPFRMLYWHSTDEEFHDLYYEYDPYEGYFGGHGLGYQEFLEIISEQLAPHQED